MIKLKHNSLIMVKTEKQLKYVFWGNRGRGVGMTISL